MNQRLRFGCLALVLCLAKPGSADQADDLVARHMQQQRIPGLSFAVLQNGKVLKMRSYGHSDLRTKATAANNTAYRIMSISKLFTSTTVMMLVEQGRLSLDDSVCSLLPEVPTSWKGVSVRHLLTHTSGLPDCLRNRAPVSEERSEALNWVYKQPLVFRPGEDLQYNQTGYVLLGMIVERITGSRFDEHLRTTIFEPTGMRHTSYARPTTSGGLSEFYIPGSNDALPIAVGRLSSYPSFLYPAAGLYSTVENLAKWESAMCNGRLLKPESIRLTHTATQLQRRASAFNPGSFQVGSGGGIGWTVQSLRGHKCVYHGGGSHSFYLRFLDEDLAIILLTNYTDAYPGYLTLQLANLYLSNFTGLKGWGGAVGEGSELLEWNFVPGLENKLRPRDP